MIQEDLVVHIDAPNDDSPKVNVMGGNNGSWTIGYVPRQAGQYYIDFVFRGKFATEPYMMPITQGSSVPEHTYRGRERNAQ